MLGIILAGASGIGYGIFQAVNRRTLQDMDVFMSTYFNLAFGTLVLIAIALVTEDISVVWTSPPAGAINFGLAGFFHFFLGWTFLNAAQKGLGAARTSALVSTLPIFGTLIAVITLGEIPNVYTIIGLIGIMVGVFIVLGQRLDTFFKMESSASYPIWAAVLYGLGASLCWAISPIFVRLGLQDLPAPLPGLTIGMVVSTLMYSIILVGRLISGSPVSFGGRSAQLWKLLAGLFVGISTWFRWESLGLTTIALVLALSLLNVPTVNIVAPLVTDRKLERVDARVWLGSGILMSGALLAIFLG